MGVEQNKNLNALNLKVNDVINGNVQLRMLIDAETQ